MAFISDIKVTLNDAEEQSINKMQFKKLPQNLNKGACGGPIYLWYKVGPTAITKLQVSFNTDMAAGLIKAGYVKIDKDLTAGAGGDPIYLWYHQGSGEFNTPIVEIDVTTDPNNEAAKFCDGLERMACDLNREAGGAWIHLWVEREDPTYICDIKVTDSYGSDTRLLKKGFMRVDENTNKGTGGSKVFIWYRETTDPKRALTGLKVSTTDEQFYALQQQKYNCLNVNLNDKAGGQPVYLWYKKGSGLPIKALALIVNTNLIGEYSKAGLTIIDNDLNAGHPGKALYLAVYQ